MNTLSRLYATSLFVVSGAALTAAPGLELPPWVADVGARHAPTSEKTFPVKTFGAVADGKTVATVAIQGAIDAAHKAGGGVVTFDPGTYLTGALFVKSHVHLRIDGGVVLLAVPDNAAYPRVHSRIAGIEMMWPSGFINVQDAEQVKISGEGQIDGNGEWCWERFATTRRDFEPRGLRWAADYEAERVRLMVISKSHDVTVQGLHLRRSGFWTVQVLYSDHVTVSSVKITDNNRGPSTDGVDIDSSSYVLVEHCDIDNNDDDICLKSGRDADGMRVNRPAEYIVVRDNITRRGAGMVAFGSETSGGIRHVVAYRNQAIGTSEGIRFKSARTRGGYIDDVLVLDTKMENVPRPITFTLDWNPAYSYVTLPKDLGKLPPYMNGRMPDYWKVMATAVPGERGISDFGNITIANVEIVGARQVISARGMSEKPLHDVHIENLTARGDSAGSVSFARGWTFKNVKLVTHDGEPLRVVSSENVALPNVEKSKSDQ